MGAEEIVPEKPVKDQIKEQKRSVDRSKRALERELKKIERFRYLEGQKYEKLSGVFPDEFKGLKKSVMIQRAISKAINIIFPFRMNMRSGVWINW